MEAHHGDVVELVGFTDKLVYLRSDDLQELLGVSLRIAVKRVQHTFGAEQLVVAVGSLSDAVRVYEQIVARVQLEGMLSERQTLHRGDGGRVPVDRELVFAAVPAYSGVLVACVSRQTLAGPDVDDRHPYGDEEILFVVFAELVVYILQYLAGAAAHQRAVLYQSFGYDHEHRRRDTLAGDVSHDHGEVIFVCHEEIVEVAADLFCRIHAGEQPELLAVGEDTRQHIRLYLVGGLELGREALLLYLFLVLLLHLFQLFAEEDPRADDADHQHEQACEEVEPYRLVKSLFLADLYGYGLFGIAQRIAHRHDEAVVAASEVGVDYRVKVAAAHGGRLVAEALKTVGYHRGHQRVVVHKSVDGQRFCIRRDGEVPVSIGVLSFIVDVDEGHRRLVCDLLVGAGLDVEPYYAGVACHVKLALIGYDAVGVGGRGARKTVRYRIAGHVDILVFEHIVGRYDIDTVAVEHPHLVLAVLDEVEVVGVGEVLYMGELVAGLKIADGVARDYPDDIALVVALHEEDGVGGQPVVEGQDLCLAVFDYIDAGAVGACEDIAVKALGYRQDDRVFEPVVPAVVFHDLVILDDAHAVACRHDDRAVAELYHAPRLVGDHAVVLRVLRQLAVVVAEHAQTRPYGHPQPVFAVCDYRAYAVTFKNLFQIGVCIRRAVELERLLQLELIVNAVLIYDVQAEVCTDEQLVVVDAGGVDYVRGQLILLVYIGKAVRGDLHNALTGRGEPQVALIVLHDLVDGVVHGRILQHFDLGALDHGDLVRRAYPYPAVDVVHAVRSREHLVGEGFRYPRGLSEIAVVHTAVIRAQIYIAGVDLAGENTAHVLYGYDVVREVFDDLAVL